jgi:hypothetical protein
LVSISLRLTLPVFWACTGHFLLNGDSLISAGSTNLQGKARARARRSRV